jgi:hypothetical protein
MSPVSSIVVATKLQLHNRLFLQRVAMLSILEAMGPGGGLSLHI